MARGRLRKSGPVVGFSVIVPSLNQGRFIDAALGSLLEQEYPSLEILVQDGGSTDDTVERLRRYGDRIRWTSGKDGGQADAIATGIGAARHEWITWLNSDDIQCGDALWAVSDAILRNPEADVIVGQGHYMDAKGARLGPYPTICTGREVDVRRELFEKGYVAQPSVYFRRAAYERVNGIDRRLRFCMDYDLWVRFALAGCTFAPCDADISGNRWYESTKTASQLLELLSEVVACQVRHFGCVSPYFVQAVSDNLYHTFHGSRFGDRNHLLVRSLYFKTVWTWFNLRRPAYWLHGLLLRSIAKSGPVVGDVMTWRDLVSALKNLLVRG